MWLRSRGLSPREAEATLLVAHGLLMRESAAQMNVTVGTVKTLIARSREKLGCHTLRELIALLLCEGVIHPEDLVRNYSSHGDRPNGAASGRGTDFVSRIQSRQA